LSINRSIVVPDRWAPTTKNGAEDDPVEVHGATVVATAIG
jgi:hypothetical protein